MVRTSANFSDCLTPPFIGTNKNQLIVFLLAAFWGSPLETGEILFSEYLAFIGEKWPKGAWPPTPPRADGRTDGRTDDADPSCHGNFSSGGDMREREREREGARERERERGREI